MTGNLYIITAASGVGKTTLVRALLALDAGIRLSVSYTTRLPRPGEVEGEDYHFVDDAQFLRMLQAGDFLESAEVHGARYGTSKARVDGVLQAGHDLILEIDWQGASQIRNLYPQAISIFIMPPSMDALVQRLNNRAKDSAQVIARRLAVAREEMAHVREFDYVTINDEFEVALADLQAIVRTQRLRLDRQMLRHQTLLEDLCKSS
ncbi:MAG TPA: guanylate kinase [Methylophilaceae bacterium]|nr:guanylate kinase [Methylophilaceae bacterium]